MSWKSFVSQWRPVQLTRLGIPKATVYDWRAGKKEPAGYVRAALELWISNSVRFHSGELQPTEMSVKSIKERW